MCCQFVQKYVEQIGQLAGMCRQEDNDAAATDLEALVSMRVSPICSHCSQQKRVLPMGSIVRVSGKEGYQVGRIKTCRHFGATFMSRLETGLVACGCLRLNCLVLRYREITRSGVPCFHATIGLFTAGTKRRWSQGVSNRLPFFFGKTLW